MTGRRLIVEADGGSRGNPGPAAFGALVRDAVTGEVLAERAETIGTTTNNVAEYRGLLAGLTAAAEIDADAYVEARLDSKLVVEQMSGRWKIKDATLRSIALEARDVLPSQRVTYTWGPRERNRDADALVNRVLDGKPLEAPSSATATPSAPRALPGWEPDLGEPTVMMLTRHGATEFSLARKFSGAGGADPALADIGVEQANAAGEEINERGPISRIVSSPLRRARETAERVAAHCGIADVGVIDDLAECAFGEWDGYTFAEVMSRWPRELEAWLASPEVAPPGGESFAAHRTRIDRVRHDLVAAHPGERIVVVAHVTPIKMMVEIALDAPLAALYRMELLPGSLTTIAWWRDGNCSMRGFAESAHLRGLDHHGG